MFEPMKFDGTKLQANRPLVKVELVEQIWFLFQRLCDGVPPGLTTKHSCQERIHENFSGDGVNLIILPYLLLTAFGRTRLSKHCRPR